MRSVGPTCGRPFDPPPHNLPVAAPPPPPSPSPPGTGWLWLMIALAALLIAAAIGVTILLPKFLHRNDVPVPAPSANHAPAPASPDRAAPAPVESGVSPNPGTTAAAAPAADATAEPGPGYDALYGQGVASAAAGDSESAVKLYLQAIPLEPTDPKAYAALGEIYLYTTGNLPEALKYYHAAIAREGTVTFHVHHDRGGGSFAAADDRLMLSNSTVAFVAGNGSDSFRVTRAEVKEAKRNRVLGLFSHGQFTVSAFHIRLESGKNYNFAPGSRFPDAERELILTILGKG